LRRNFVLDNIFATSIAPGQYKENKHDIIGPLKFIPHSTILHKILKKKGKEKNGNSDLFFFFLLQLFFKEREYVIEKWL